MSKKRIVASAALLVALAVALNATLDRTRTSGRGGVAPTQAGSTRSGASAGLPGAASATSGRSESRRRARARTPFLGVVGITITARLNRLSQLTSYLDIDHGVLVQGVSPASPAARAGIRGGSLTRDPELAGLKFGGDEIVAVNGSATASVEDLQNALTQLGPGEGFTIRVRRRRRGSDGLESYRPVLVRATL